MGEPANSISLEPRGRLWKLSSSADMAVVRHFVACYPRLFGEAENTSNVGRRSSYVLPGSSLAVEEFGISIPAGDSHSLLLAFSSTVPDGEAPSPLDTEYVYLKFLEGSVASAFNELDWSLPGNRIAYWLTVHSSDAVELAFIFWKLVRELRKRRGQGVFGQPLPERRVEFSFPAEKAVLVSKTMATLKQHSSRSSDGGWDTHGELTLELIDLLLAAASGNPLGLEAARKILNI